MNTFKKLKAGFEAAAKVWEPSAYRVGEHAIRCVQCGHDTFERGEAQLNTAPASLFEVDWLNESVTTLLCTECSHIMWFGKAVERVEG